jgi:hypothetical protein
LISLPWLGPAVATLVAVAALADDTRRPRAVGGERLVT